MKTKKILAAALAGSMLASCISAQTVFAEPEIGGNGIFYDDFSGDSLDTNKWLIAEKTWGGWNGGVVPENVSVSNGTLKLEGHGNLYTGDVKGANKNLSGGVRTGAAIATREYYASGSYEVVAKVAPELGACSAIWTFEYEEYYPDDPEYKAAGGTGAYATVNHEIDIEIPTASDSHEEPSFSSARFNTYVRENKYTSKFYDLPESVDDGEFHTYRFDWHTGDDDEQARVDFYVDGEHLYTSTTNIPTNASRLWIGIWFPCGKDSDNDGYGDTGWTGTADFDTTVFEIDSVKITPYHETGDTVGNETYGKNGWAADSFPEDIEEENFDHIVNGDFSDGSNNWKIVGDAKIVDNAAYLETGGVTRTITQTVKVKPKMTYTVTADIKTDGTIVTLGARKANGEGNTSEDFSTSGTKSVTFTTESGATEMDIYVQVLRYQNGNPATADNITLYSGTESHPGTSSEPSATPTPTATPEPTATSEPTTSPETTETESTKFTQKATVEKGATYKLSADVETDGDTVTIGVNGYNGDDTKTEKTVNESGKVSLVFTASNDVESVELFMEVLRNQDVHKSAAVNNFSLEKIADADASPSATTIPSKDSSETEENLLVNGDFSNAEDNWEISGSAQIVTGEALLASGSDTDKITQSVALEPNTAYVLTGDVVTDGCEVELYVKGYDGKYSKRKAVLSQTGTGAVEFVTGEKSDAVNIVIQVLRYQDADNAAHVSNLKLTKSS